MIDRAFWSGKKVFLSGHTGFKGAWMSLVLRRLEAEVYGFALPPESNMDLFVAAEAARDVHHTIGDVRDLGALHAALAASAADVVVHMAAQSLVRRSYHEPVDTYATNVMGTVHMLEAVRRVPAVAAVIIVTSDKCYESIGSTRAHREGDALGGHDPYSSSKGCAEIITSSYRRSFFQGAGTAAVASVRAGNVVGGGDWASDRLVPDAMRAFSAGKVLRIRSPRAVRPWQHVLDSTLAYLLLAQRLLERGHIFADGWNIGPPSDNNDVTVSTIADTVARLWGEAARWTIDDGAHRPETTYLKLDCAKAKTRLGWQPLLDIQGALELTVEWHRALHDGGDVRALSLQQIDRMLEMQMSPRMRLSVS